MSSLSSVEAYRCVISSKIRPGFVDVGAEQAL
jgi:hypothetical protein